MKKMIEPTNEKPAAAPAAAPQTSAAAANNQANVGAAPNAAENGMNIFHYALMLKEQDTKASWESLITQVSDTDISKVLTVSNTPK